MKKDNRYICCRSTYIGLDLHSYPPRTGNYLAHSLIYEGIDTFNPVELYNRYNWKTGEIVENDDSTNPPFHIDKGNLELEDTFYPIPLNELLKEEYRHQFLKKAIELILEKKKLIIVDENKSLLNWTFSLLHFSLKSLYLNISGFLHMQILT